ncbi:MAG: hypothetical protein WBP44_03370 [Gammaproteobacteria bacterium]
MIARSIVFLILLLPGFSAANNDYEQQHAIAVGACEAVDASDYQSGLALNPDGYRSYYLRSQCYQKAAVRFRDSELCTRVRQRRSLFSSSWGYSKSNCKKLVEKEIAGDREAIDGMKNDYQQGHVRLSDFRIERNGNGRDFDIIPAFSGAGAHGYMLLFEIIRDGAGLSPVLLDASGFYLEGNTSNIRIYVRQQDIRKRFPGFALNTTWQVRATLIYSVGTGSYNGKWSDTFIESRFPENNRTQIMMKEIRF